MRNVIFHVHTKFSFDGYTSFSAIYKECKKLNADIICITDHDTIKGAVTFRNWLVEKKINDLHVVTGVEVTCCDGTHIIGLFISEEIDRELTPIEVVDEIIKQGGMVYFPHPARKDGILKSKFSLDVLPKGHFYELFNAKISHDYNLLTSEYFIANAYKLKPLGGSDAHYNNDLRKSLCIFKMDFECASFKQAMTDYFDGRINVDILGYPNQGRGGGYFSLYYKYKHLIGLPTFIKSIAKKLYPFYVNLRTKKATYQLIKFN